MTLSDLIERLEKATGPDREMDEDIVRALYPDCIIQIYVVGDEDKTVFHAEPLVPNKSYVPLYTSSIDAALTLVPEGYGWSLYGGFSPNRPCACLSDTGRSDDLVDAFGATPAIAICIASLKARAAIKEESDGL